MKTNEQRAHTCRTGKLSYSARFRNRAKKRRFSVFMNAQTDGARYLQFDGFF